MHLGVQMYRNRAWDTHPSRTHCPMVVPMTFKEEARQNGCLMLLGFRSKLLFSNRHFFPCFSSQTLTFLPKIATSITSEPHKPHFPPALPHGGVVLPTEQLYLTRRVLEAVRPKNSQHPWEQESYFRGFKIAAAQIIS